MASKPPATPGALEDRSVSITRGNLLALPVVAAAFGAAFGLHIAVWGSRSLAPIAPPSIWVLLAVLLSIPGHEGLHAVGLLLAGASRTAIRIGIDWKTMTPSAYSTAPVSARSYRLALALPAFLLGVVPSAVGIGINSGGLTFFGAANIALAGGDVVIMGLLRDLAGSALVLDHPNRMGCVVVRAPDEHATA